MDCTWWRCCAGRSWVIGCADALVSGCSLSSSTRPGRFRLSNSFATFFRRILFSLSQSSRALSFSSCLYSALQSTWVHFWKELVRCQFWIEHIQLQHICITQQLHYSMVSIKLPVLLNNLVWIFPKSLYLMTRSISEKNDCSALFQGRHSQFLVSFKGPGLDMEKVSITRPVLSFFQIIEAKNDQVL